MNDKVMVFGCGNIIMGDDGFGPSVVDALNSRYDLPENIEAVDAGTGVREFLFDYLLAEELRPSHIIIVDAVDFPDRTPGELFEITTDQIPSKKIHDFSLHQFPTVNLLHELKEHTGIRVTILAAQIQFIPDEIAPGLTEVMSHAVDEACETIARILSINVK